MNYKLVHQTQYTYTGNVNNYHGIACLMPKISPRQNCTNFALQITPMPDEISQRTDYFGNTLHHFSIHQPHTQLTVLATSMIETRSSIITDLFMTNREVKEQLRTNHALKTQLLEYMIPSSFVQWDEEIRSFGADCFSENQSFYQSARQLCHKIYTEFKYVSGFTTIHTPLKTVLKERKGVCQDFSHLAIACFRSLGFAARYISGYLETQPPPGKTKLQGSDATHAWVSVYAPGVGWCDFDPTNDLVPQEKHITTAWGRDFGDVSPLRGIVFSTGKQTFKVGVDVIPV
ncbi:transglutaminase [Siphonobacter sp. BAB-5385]|uniref:transglutaminase family protein n=1 Tax=Siphonobacter sp. BAB-5385 TaxID=1864822 RepID=UPI000B9E3FDE|nr:transglutaminase family protein [Siphonobacter sp. BAB-5385]OZI05450.1 transglutaminase [Siphonobacter sp. BAB-5385]